MVSCKDTPYGECLFIFGVILMEDTKHIVKNLYTCLFVLGRTDIYEGLRDKYLKEHISSIPLRHMIMFWRNEKNMYTKEKMENLLARKIMSMDFILNNNPDILENYLPVIRDISSLDAITTLMQSKNDTIFDIVYPKYCELFDAHLEQDNRLNNIVLIKE